MVRSRREKRIGFVGAGALGKGLALALYRLGYDVCAVASRRRESAEALAAQIAGCRALDGAQDVADVSDLVFITTPDSAIASVAASVRWRPGQEVVHCCGASGRDLLKAVENQGGETGAFHPFQTFAGIDTPDQAVARLNGVTFALSAGKGLAEFLGRLADDLGGRTVAVSDEDRPLYHAAAVLGCVYLATVIQAALEALEAAEFSGEEGLAALAVISQATLDNVRRLGPEASATGPLVRGDVDTVHRHLSALLASSPAAGSLYGALTEGALPLARRRGLDPAAEAAIRQVLSGMDSGSFRSWPAEDNTGEKR